MMKLLLIGMAVEIGSSTARYMYGTTGATPCIHTPRKQASLAGFLPENFPYRDQIIHFALVPIIERIPKAREFNTIILSPVWFNMRKILQGSVSKAYLLSIFYKARSKLHPP